MTNIHWWSRVQYLQVFEVIMCIFHLLLFLFTPSFWNVTLISKREGHSPTLRCMCWMQLQLWNFTWQWTNLKKCLNDTIHSVTAASFPAQIHKTQLPLFLKWYLQTHVKNRKQNSKNKDTLDEITFFDIDKW